MGDAEQRRIDLGGGAGCSAPPLGRLAIVDRRSAPGDTGDPAIEPLHEKYAFGRTPSRRSARHPCAARRVRASPRRSRQADGDRRRHHQGQGCLLHGDRGDLALRRAQRGGHRQGDRRDSRRGLTAGVEACPTARPTTSTRSSS
jgi:hypothetical protein